MEPSRAILLTPPGTGAIAVVRLIGPAIHEFLRAHFCGKPAAGRCIHGNITDGERIIDDAVVVLAPEHNLVDISLHGGPWVIRSVLDLSRRSGFQVIEPTPHQPVPGEAVDAPTILEREILTHLPLARTDLALRTLLAQKQAWALLTSLTNPEELQQLARAVLQDHALIYLLAPPRVAIIGAPNVGKSTLANQLFAQERSITADLPGTTRDWVGEIANLDGLAVMLIDTPGQHAAADAIERLAIDASSSQIRSADLIVLVLDQTLSFEGEQRTLLDTYPDALRIINKSDRPSCWNAEFTGQIRTIATTGQGIDTLRSAIRRHFGCEALDPNQPRYWTDRQRAFLERAAENPSAQSKIKNQKSKITTADECPDT